MLLSVHLSDYSLELVLAQIQRYLSVRKPRLAASLLEGLPDWLR